jgi:hypothetical protein
VLTAGNVSPLPATWLAGRHAAGGVECNRAAPGHPHASSAPCNREATQLTMRVQLIQRGSNTCAETSLPSGPGKTALCNTSAPDNGPNLCAREVGIGREVNDACNEAPRAPERANGNQHEKFREEAVKAIALVHASSGV